MVNTHNQERAGHRLRVIALCFTAMSGALASVADARVEAPVVLRQGDALVVRWQDSNPVAVYESARPGVATKEARLLVPRSVEGSLNVQSTGGARRYFTLVDRKDGSRVEVAERSVPLQQGSNFRDLGGYPAAGGKHVRWGLLYRSGGQPLLTDMDVQQIRALGVQQLVDLRSSEERVLAPTRIAGVPYAAVGYEMSALLPSAAGGTLSNGADVYRSFPTLLAPQLRIILDHMSAKGTPLAFNCSAGQDRTGFVSAVLLRMLGVPYETVVADYHLSTQLRRPEFELPPIDLQRHAGEPVAQLFARYQQAPEWRTPQPLKDADGRPFLRGAMEEIERSWGSVDNYVVKAVGISPAQLAAVRRAYLQ